MPPQFFRMLRAELLKVFTRFSGLAVVLMAVALPLATVAVLYLFGGTSSTSNVGGQVTQSILHFDVVGAMKWSLKVRNFILLPLMLILATASSVAGEQADHTLRELVVRPVPRWSILAVKQLSLWALSIVTIVVGLLTTIGAGWLVCGPPDMDQSVADPAESLYWASLGFALSFLSDVAIIALGTAFSTLIRSVGGVVMSLAIVLAADRAVWTLLYALSSDMLQVAWAKTAILYTLTDALGAWDHWHDGFHPTQFVEALVVIAAAWAVSIVRFSRTDVP